MANPIGTILALNFRGWLGTKGFVLVLVGALFPMLLTGAWVATHQADLVVSSLAWEGPEPQEGENATLVATFLNQGGTTVGRFNVTVAVGTVTGTTLLPEASNITTIESLGPGESKQVRLTFAPRPGVKAAVAIVDSDAKEAIGEREEANNQKVLPLVVRFKVPGQDAAPRGPADLGGDPNGTALAALSVTGLQMPSDPKAGQAQNFTVTVRNDGSSAVTNATAVLRVGRASGTSFFSQRDTTRNVDLAPGETTTLSLTWDAAEGVFWVEAYVQSKAARDPTPTDNRVIQAFVVQPQPPAEFKEPAPPDRATIKQFYLDIFALLQLRIIVPLIALYYAAGALADEREAGNLTYLLTRPVPRWSIPLAKMLAGFLVAAVAIVIGLIGTYALLFGTSFGGDVGFLTTALLTSLVALFAYGGLFLLLGVLIERPYLVGLAFVLGWETLAASFVDWVRQLTLSHYISRMLCIPATGGSGCVERWPFDQGLALLPAGPQAQAALYLVLAVAVLLVGGAMYAMKRKEFPA